MNKRVSILPHYLSSVYAMKDPPQSLIGDILFVYIILNNLKYHLYLIKITVVKMLDIFVISGYLMLGDQYGFHVFILYVNGTIIS